MLRLALTATVLFGCISIAAGQSGPARPVATPRPGQDTRLVTDKDDLPNFGSPEIETRTKLILKEEKKRYDENLARAREVCEIASQLKERYITSKSFNADDSKRLERLEKLTKRIRNEAGGSDGETDAELKDISAATEKTVKRMAELAEELQKAVEKTPRNVISAAVIEQANRLIGVTRHLRLSR